MLMPDVVPDKVQPQPGWVLWLEALVLAEICGYWGHRLSHQINKQHKDNSSRTLDMFRV